MALGSISLNFWYVVAKIVLNNDCFGTFSKKSLLDLDFDLERSRDHSLLTPHKCGFILKVLSSWFRIYIILGIGDLRVKSYDRLKPTMLKSGFFPIHSNLLVYVKIWHCRPVFHPPGVRMAITLQKRNLHRMSFSKVSYTLNYLSIETILIEIGIDQYLRFPC